VNHGRRRAGLLAEATRNLEDWRASQFLDIGQAVRRYAHHGHTAPQAVAERVAREIGWLTELDVSTLGQVYEFTLMRCHGPNATRNMLTCSRHPSRLPL
jgi:hypothetical protein